MKDQSTHGDFERLMLPHLDAAYNLARWLVRDPTLAEDVVQDAYERAYKYFPGFRGGSGRPWLLQIVRNVAYTNLGAERWGMEVSLSGGTREEDESEVDMDIPDWSPSPEATVAARQEIVALDEALNALPVAWRECLILREVEMLSYREIARITNVPVGTVMSRLARARRKLLFAARSAASDRSPIQRRSKARAAALYGAGLVVKFAPLGRRTQASARAVE